MALLDGRYVNDDEINPSIHRFIGMFRHPYPPVGRADVVMCGCGAALWFVQDVSDHWRLGHMDMPQYVTMKKDDSDG